MKRHQPCALASRSISSNSSRPIRKPLSAKNSSTPKKPDNAIIRGHCKPIHQEITAPQCVIRTMLTATARTTSRPRLRVPRSVTDTSVALLPRKGSTVIRQLAERTLAYLIDVGGFTNHAAKDNILPATRQAANSNAIDAAGVATAPGIVRMQKCHIVPMEHPIDDRLEFSTLSHLGIDHDAGRIVSAHR